jgi:hypothetical protein
VRHLIAALACVATSCAPSPPPGAGSFQTTQVRIRITFAADGTIAKSEIVSIAGTPLPEDGEKTVLASIAKWRIPQRAGGTYILPMRITLEQLPAGRWHKEGGTPMPTLKNR